MNELTKIAESEASYLTKCAEVAELFANGKVTAREADTAAADMGLNIDDVAAVYTANYGGQAGSDIEKTASEQVEEGTYLQKTASVADLIASGAIATPEDITKVATDHRLAVSDIESIYNLAYEPSDLDKTAALDEANDILASLTATQLEKTAAIASMFDNGIVSSEDATAAAAAYGIDVDDINSLLSKEADSKKAMWDIAKQKARIAGKKGLRIVKKNPGKTTAAAVGAVGTIGAGTAYAMNRNKDGEDD